MLYKIGICDDDSYFINILIDALTRYEQSHNFRFQITPFSSGEELLAKYSEQHFNLLFLDVEMDSLTGIDVAKALRHAGEKVHIIYITAYASYAHKAFSVDADNYLDKPINDEILYPALDRILHTIDVNAALAEIKNTYITLSSREGIIQLPYSDILYISKANNNLIFHTSSNEHSTYMNIKDILQILDTTIFVKINQGQIVNWPKIKSLKKGIVTIGNTKLPISRPNITKLTKRYRYELEQKLRTQEIRVLK